MEARLVPDPGADDPVARAVALALAREGLLGDLRPSGLDGAWRRAGIEEALERGQPDDGYVPAVRRTPGTTRA